VHKDRKFTDKPPNSSKNHHALVDSGEPKRLTKLKKAAVIH